MTATYSGKQAVRAPVAGNRTMIILYGSETGNAEEIAMALGKMTERLHFQTWVDEMDNFKLTDLLKASLVIFVTSTTGQGDMPKNTTRFWRNLRREKLNNTNCLRNLTFALFGLGDSSYPKFNWAARKLGARLLQLGASEFFRAGEADERHENGLDSVYLPWSQDLRITILNQHPLPEGLQPIPAEEQLPPKHLLRLASARDPEIQLSDGASVEDPRFLGGPRSLSENKDTVTEDAPTSYLPKSLPHKPAEFPPDSLLDIPGTVIAKVIKNERMTPEAHWQDVRHLILQIPNHGGLTLDEAAGSTAIIWPKNYPEDVQILIDLMGWGEIADKTLDLDSEVLARKSKLHLFSRRETLRDLLIHNFDINSVPKRTFIEDLAFFTKEPLEIERLRELTKSGNEQDYYDYTSRPRRTIIELLRDFPGVKIPFERALDLFPLIRGREFSLANGDTVPDNAAPPQTLKLELIIALLSYRTIIRKPREGLCSRYIKNLPVGTLLPIGIKAPARRVLTAAAAARPLIAVATGTGVAPIRAFIQERALAAGAAGPTKLFFGCRNRNADFLFGEEWGRYPGVEVHAAFSRDPVPPNAVHTGDAGAVRQYDTGKNYVQHKIREYGDEIVAMLTAAGGERPIICVCGNAGRMPVSVREAFKDVLVRGKVVADGGEAEVWLSEGGNVMYWQETW